MIELFSNPINWIHWLFPIVLIKIAALFYKKLLPLLKGILKGYGRRSKLKELKRIQKIRRNHYEVYAHIAKSASYFTLFLLSATLLYLLLISSSYYGSYTNDRRHYFYVAMIPVLFFEILWLRQDGFTKLLVKHASKVKM